jgi:hypothetical protein
MIDDGCRWALWVCFVLWCCGLLLSYCGGHQVRILYDRDEIVFIDHYILFHVFNTNLTVDEEHCVTRQARQAHSDIPH